MKNAGFLLKRVELDFGAKSPIQVDLIGPNANLKSTHISLIAGANGTSKSRLLAAFIDRLCTIESGQALDKYSRRLAGQGALGLMCTGLETVVNGSEGLIHKNESDLVGDIGLPSRVLALSNLVMDKFHFPRDTQSEDPFYHYLGVRQATNLTTTGSVERSVGEAVLRMASDRERLNAFQDWLNLVFGGGRELAFLFPRITRSEIKKFLDNPSKEEYVLERMKRRLGSARVATVNEQLVLESTKEIRLLFEFLLTHLTEYVLPGGSSKSRPEAFIRISALSDGDRIEFTSLIKSFSTASRAGFSAWPALCIEGAPWIPFGQLSSGEQNILSVGAKLIAHSRAGCLVVIDEPEVSLNVTWQQQYTELILKSLAHAPGSHVVIATHSPHLISSLPHGTASIVLAEREGGGVTYKTLDAEFEGWGSESVLYQVLGIPSASSFHLNKDLALVLRHIQEGGRDKQLIRRFIEKISRIDYKEVEPLGLVVSEIRTYLDSLK
ncbi:AAA family ATPase [Ideonella sp. A 288]|uniref:AAA family ATPase n=1 Tax=Ideonella sp. A 288 TaxID=1962181 RepID=UPI000B4B4479|nr:AAA family ATPase [Ideonella sp. A 288]